MWETWQVIGLLAVSLALYETCTNKLEITWKFVLFSIVAVVEIFMNV